MFGLLWFLLIGLVAGAIARFIIPGDDRLGCLGTMLLGVIGSFVGGLLGSLIAGRGLTLTATGLVGSTVGAIVVLIIRRLASRAPRA